jgi:hypothetical protein
VYTDFVTWLQFERPEELPVLIHPYTDEMVSGDIVLKAVPASGAAIAGAATAGLLLWHGVCQPDTAT